MQTRSLALLWILAATAAVAPLAAASEPAAAAPFTFIVTMSGAQVVPPAQNGLSGFGQLVYDADDRSLIFSIIVIGAAPQNVGSSELRQGALGTNGTLVAQLAAGGSTQVGGRITLPAGLEAAMLGGQLYLEVRGSSGALIRGQVLAPAVPGVLPAPPLPPIVVVPAAATQPQAPAQQAGAPSTAGAIRPPATGDGGLR